MIGVEQARRNPLKPNYMDWQDELTPQLRGQMVETIMYAGYHLRLKTDTTFRAVSVLDAVMSVSRYVAGII